MLNPSNSAELNRDGSVGLCPTSPSKRYARELQVELAIYASARDSDAFEHHGV